MSDIRGGDRGELMPSRTFVVAGVGAVVAGLGSMALTAVLAGVGVVLLGLESDPFVHDMLVPVFMPAAAIIFGVCVGRATWRWIVSMGRRS